MRTKTMMKRMMMKNYDKKNKEVFTSLMDFAEAKVKAITAGYVPIAQSRNRKGEYLIFGRKIKT